MDKMISVSYLDAKNVNVFFKSLSDLNVWIHVDVMDEKFVPNKGADIKYIKEAKKEDFFVDTHLMVEKPIEDGYIDEAVSLGTNGITIHYEIDNFEKVLNKLNEIKEEKNKKGEKFLIGVSLKPGTDVKVLEKYNDKFDLLLLMSVEPGLGGQKYIISTNDKIKEAKRIYSDKIIQIDGGINFNTFLEGYKCGCDNFVIGSYFSKSKDVISSFKALEILCDFEKMDKKENLEFDKRVLQIVDGGYGQNDILLGITSPKLRKLASKWYKNVSLNVLEYYINSDIHEYRKFSLFCLSNMAKSKKYNLEEIVEFVNNNIEKIDNWDLTDEVSPNVIGKYLLTLTEDKKKKVIDSYLKSENYWVRRIGIASCLTLARNGDYLICESVAKRVMYDDNHLIQKAAGWLLREVYKKHPKEVVKFLKENIIEKKSGKKIGKFVISYVSEKLSKIEKEEIKKEKK